MQLTIKQIQFVRCVKCRHIHMESQRKRKKKGYWEHSVCPRCNSKPYYDDINHPHNIATYKLSELTEDFKIIQN